MKLKWRPFHIYLVLLLSACGGNKYTPAESWAQADDGVYAAALTYDGSLSVVSDTANGVKVWDMDYRQIRYQLTHHVDGGGNLVGLIALAFDNSYVVTADRGAFALWDLADGEPVGAWRIDESSVRDVAVSNQGRGILVGRGNGKVMYFEPETGRRLEFLGHQEKINSVDLSPNGHYALSGGNDYTAYLWDTRSGQVLFRFNHPSRVTKVALDPYGRYAFTADSKKHARVWDLTTGREHSRLSYFERQKIFSSVRFSEDGKQLLTGSPSRSLDLWEIDSGNKLDEWRVAPKAGSRPEGAVVYAVGFADNNRVVSISSSGLAEVWSG